MLEWETAAAAAAPTVAGESERTPEREFVRGMVADPDCRDKRSALVTLAGHRATALPGPRLAFLLAVADRAGHRLSPSARPPSRRRVRPLKPR